MTHDIIARNEGSIWLFHPTTEAGREWLDEHTDGTWFGGALVVEHRYVADLATGAMQDGLVVASDWPR